MVTQCQLRVLSSLPGPQTHLDLVCPSNHVCACVLVLHHPELHALPVCLHLAEGLVQCCLLAGCCADHLQLGQLLQQVKLKQVPDAEGSKACSTQRLRHLQRKMVVHVPITASLLGR
jgi:hypothetical protein